MRPLLILAVLATLGCDREIALEAETRASASAEPPVPSQRSRKSEGSQAPLAQDGDGGLAMAPDSDRPVWPRPLSSADVDKAFDDIYGEAARHSEEDRRLIRFAEQQMGPKLQRQG